jgi:Ni/Co efflux regulator RcnB
MKTYWLATAVAFAVLGLAGNSALAQEGQPGHFNEHDQQVAKDWANQHQTHAPAGFRSQDRLSADEESRLHEGAVLDKDLRRKVHPVPQDLERQLPPPPSSHRYVAIGGHIGLIDNNFQLKAVIHLHD